MTVLVPFLDLKAQYASIKDEVSEALHQVLESAAFAGGRFVEEFEKDFASYCQCADAIGCGSGTAALWMALLAAGIGEGDEVITTPNTFIATVEAIHFAGAKTVFVDVDESAYTMDPFLLETAITPKTKAIIPVHLYGQCCDMDPIMAVANAHDLTVIEDACQAHGADYKSRRAGSIGNAGCFSFYPGKNLGAYGEAGAVVTNDLEFAERMRMFRDHGQARKYHHSMMGWNARMDGFQGAVLQVKLRHLPAWTEARRANAQRYTKLLADIEGIETPKEMDWATHVYHIYAVRAHMRDTLIADLGDQGISCGIHYPVPLHLQEACSHLGYSVGDFPITEALASELVSLPMYPELRQEQIEAVVEAQISSLNKIAPR